jgi:hypothetical protein
VLECWSVGVLECWSVAPSPNCTPRPRGWGCSRGVGPCPGGTCRTLARRDVMKGARQFIAWYPRENGNRPVGHGMIGSVKRATISTTNQPGIRIRPCPRDGFSIESVPAPTAFGAGYLHSIPSGQGHAASHQSPLTPSTRLTLAEARLLTQTFP